MLKRTIITAVLVAGFAGLALAQGAPGMGPVAQNCNDDMAKYCAGKEHGGRAIRACLEQNKAKLTDACKKALDTTGPGRGMGGMGGMGRGMGGMGGMGRGMGGMGGMGGQQR